MGLANHWSAAPGVNGPVGLLALAAAPHQHRFGREEGLVHSEACNHPNVPTAVQAILGYINPLTPPVPEPAGVP
jgi:hypothetical protein